MVNGTPYRILLLFAGVQPGGQHHRNVWVARARSLVVGGYWTWC